MSQLYIQSFLPKPINGSNTSNMSVIASNTSASLGSMAGQRQQNVRILNNGANLVFINFSVGAGTAVATTDMPILPNSVEVFQIPATVTHINAIALATGNTLYWTVGDGA